MLSRLYRILKIPWVYRISQWILAAGEHVTMDRYIRRVLGSSKAAGRLLDLGCGPDSWLLRQDLEPVGLDVSRRYVMDLSRKGATGVVGSADALPFAAESFDGVFSVGLFHHLPDDMVERVMSECERVCRSSSGYLALIDAVLPRHPWRRPLAYWIRRADRGRFMRTEEQLRGLLLADRQWSVARHTYTLTGLEVAVCVCRFERDGDGASSPPGPRHDPA
jgi:SAM-dependent methyltransferase